MSMHETQPPMSVVMSLGRGYDVVEGQYLPTPETVARATEAATYRRHFPDNDTLYLFSGGYAEVASRGRVTTPPPGVSEAAMQQRVFGAELRKDPHPYTQARQAIEPYSIDTFTNVLESITGGHLQVGAYSAKSPLAVSTSQAHSWRIGVIAEQALALEQPGSLWRLKDSGLENTIKQHSQERILLAVTRLALADVGEYGGAEPGNLAHTKAATEAFGEMSRTPVRTVMRALAHPRFWTIAEVPVVQYG